MAWIFLAELVESDLDSANGLEQSPIVSKTDMHKAFYCPVCDQVTLIKRLSGTMLKHSKAKCCQESTLSSEDSPAKTLALPALEKVWTESEADCSFKSCDWLASFDLDSFSWKTSQLSLLEDSNKLQWNSLRWGSIVDGRLYQPQRLEPHTREIDGSLWPTPIADDANNVTRDSGAFQSLTRTVRKWPTPLATDARNYLSGGGRDEKEITETLSLSEVREKRPRETGAGHWAVEPSVGRVVDGVQNRVDRIRCLGNSVVPLAVEKAFKKLIGIGA
jgi:hypothetical protein